MMYGLPASTELSKQLAKERVFAKFKVGSAAQELFNADISTMFIANHISEETVPGLKSGKTVKGIYVLALNLKQPVCDAKNLALLAKMIPQKMVFALFFDGKVQFAISHERLHLSELVPVDDAKLEIRGTYLDEVWENLVKAIGNVVVEEGRTLEGQIEANELRKALERKIECLTEKAYREKQPRRKSELWGEIETLKRQLENI